VENRLAYVDQGSFLAMRAFDAGLLVHLTWVFDEHVDMDGLNRFRANLERGLLGRLVEPSRLPWGRHRWVRLARSYALDIADQPRPRSQLREWVTEIAALPIDPQFGPGWRLAVLPFDDGGSAVLLVVNHTIADALGMVIAATEAVSGTVQEMGYPAPGSRRSFAGLWADFVDSLRDLTGTGRAIKAAFELAIRPAANPSGASAAVEAAPISARPPARRDEQLSVPSSVVVRISAAQWTEVAKRLGGSNAALFSAWSVLAGRRLDRLRPDGKATLVLPVSRREAGDSRGNALSSMTLDVDPAGLVDDLSGLRAQIRQAYTDAATLSMEEQTLPLVPFVPGWLLRSMEAKAIDSSAKPIGCSSIGVLPDELTCIDGIHHGYVHTWLAEVPQRLSRLDAIGGKMFTVFSQCGDGAWLNIVAKFPHADDSVEALWAAAEGACRDFGLEFERV
jgi:diacylglycerol O-acyltransferase / wax synthase